MFVQVAGTVMAFGLFLFIIMVITLTISRFSGIYYLAGPISIMCVGLIVFWKARQPYNMILGGVTTLVSGITILIIRFTFLPRMAKAARDLSTMGGASDLDATVIAELHTVTVIVGVWLCAMAAIYFTTAIRKINQEKEIV